MIQVTTKQKDSLPPLKTNDPLVAHGIDIKEYTNAPLKFKGEFIMNCTPEKLWPLVTDANKIGEWFLMVSGGYFNDSTSETPGTCGVGSSRHCNTFGMGTLNERILRWEQPKISMYSASAWSMPVKNHVGVMILEPVGAERCKFIWRHYYDYKGLVMRHIFPIMMGSMMNMGIAKLTQMAGGGDGGKMVKMTS